MAYKIHSKSQNGQAKNLHKKEQHVLNNCLKLRSRAIKNANIFFYKNCGKTLKLELRKLFRFRELENIYCQQQLVENNQIVLIKRKAL